MRITWLADVLRADGLTVVEHAGWQTRAVAGTWEPRYGIVHATAAPRTQSDTVQVRVVRDGREGLSGPIANACVDRAGRWHVLGVGRCNTTLPGTAGPYEGLGNTHALGVEACNDNRDEPWPDVQYRAYVRGWAAIARRLGWDPSRLRGHKEHTPGHKTDPTFSMSRFRGDVAAVLAGQEDDMAWTDKLDGTPSTASRFGPGDHQAQTLLKLAAIHAYDAAKGASAARLLGEAILAQVAGDDQEAVLGRVDALAQQLAEQAAADAARDVQASLERAALADLIRQHADGTLDADQVVDAIARRLADQPDTPTG